MRNVVSPAGDFVDRWHGFRDRHCLSDLLLYDEFGVFNPELWFVSSQTNMLIEAPDFRLSKFVPLGAVMNILERACNMIAAQMSDRFGVGGREIEALRRWRSRNDPKGTGDLIRLYTGVDDHRLLERMSSETGATQAIDFMHHNSEILAAARMRPEGVTNDAMSAIFDAISSVPKVETKSLDELSGEAVHHLTPLLNSNELPFLQGHGIANWLRDRLGYDWRAMINPAELLRVWNVPVRSVRLGNSEIDALAFWGPKHGPAIVINRDGIHAGPVGRRATYAHEICHLLVDRTQKLPLADIIGGQVPESIEQRARAFAAELLLPSRIAYESFLQTDQSLHEVSAALTSLMEVFRISRSTAAHQLRHGLRQYHHHDRKTAAILAYIDSITSLDWIDSRIGHFN